MRAVPDRITRRLRRSGRDGRSKSAGEPVPDERWRILHPSTRIDGRPLADQTGAAPVFLGHLDEPWAPAISSYGLPVVRVRGWVVSTRGRVLHVRVGCEDHVAEITPDEARPEIPAAVEGILGEVTPECGFTVDVPVPSPGEGIGSVELVIDVGDGEVVTTRRCVVTITDRPLPPRADYKSTWDATAHDAASAKVAVLGSADETDVRTSAEATVELLDRTIGIRATDEVCEIGCGVGRMGEAIAPRCRRWIGCDVSPRMLAHARDRLTAHDNVELVELSGWDLAPIPSASLDVVYCTTVFMHLDEWERYAYVGEARRVLRSGGRLYVDNFNLCGEEGWALFLQVADLHPLGRPPNVSKSSTPDELRTYLVRAGFEDVVVDTYGGMWVYATGRVS